MCLLCLLSASFRDQCQMLAQTPACDSALVLRPSVSAPFVVNVSVMALVTLAVLSRCNEQPAGALRQSLVYSTTRYASII